MNCLVCQKEIDDVIVHTLDNEEWTIEQMCSELCYEKFYANPDSKNKCFVCGNDSDFSLGSENGKYFCNSNCEKQYFTCYRCYDEIGGLYIRNGEYFYCSIDCAEDTTSVCHHCENEFDLVDGFELIDDFVSDIHYFRYCSTICLEKETKKCVICEGHFYDWSAALGNPENSRDYCSEECILMELPQCTCCGERNEEWYIDQSGKVYCSEKCFDIRFPNCIHCNSIAETPIWDNTGRVFCSSHCQDNNNMLVDKVLTICEVTGLLPVEVNRIVEVNQWDLNHLAENIDNTIESLEKNIPIADAIVTGFKNAEVFEKLKTNLVSYNTMRGGKKGFKGFVFEELHAVNETIKGTTTDVIANNGIADFLILNQNGTRSYAQAKIGYKTGTIDWDNYKGQTIVVDKGNKKLIQSAKKAGLDVVESDISKVQSKKLADLMQLESKVFGITNAPITSKLYTIHQSGLTSAKRAGVLGAGISIGSNIVDVFTGEESISNATMNVAKETAKASATSYAVGSLAQTSLGTAVTTNINVSSMIFTSGKIGSTIAKGTAIATNSAGAAAGVISSTAVGSSIIAGTAAATAAVKGTAIGAAATGAISVVAGTAVGSTVIAAAPIIATGAAIGGLIKVTKSIFKRR